MAGMLQEDAVSVVDNFINKYRSAAIPSLMGACVMWAVENGAPDLMRDTLKSLTNLLDEMEAHQLAVRN